MKKRMFIGILCLVIMIAGGITVYACLGHGQEADYSSGMFVDGGDTNNGYATMYDLYTVI